MLPKFKNEKDERNFWVKINLADYFEPEDFVPVSFPNLKTTTKPVSIRLPESMIDRVKERANDIDVPYQALIKQFINQGLQSHP